MKKIILSIDGMTCSACSSGLEKYLNKQSGIIHATVNLIMASATIEYDEKMINQSKIETMVADAGFTSLGEWKELKREGNNHSVQFQLILYTILAIFLMYISMGHMFHLPVPSFLDSHTSALSYMTTVFLLTILFLFYGRDILKNGYKNLIHKTPNMDTLVALGVITSFFYSLYNMCLVLKGNIAQVNNLYFESSALVIYFLKLGRYIDGMSKDKTKEAIQKLVEITPKQATLKVNDEYIVVTLDEIKKGDIVVAKAGEKIAVDGEIISGKTHLDESFITGESKPVSKSVGDKVIAGSLNYDGVIEYIAKRIGKDSMVSEIVKRVVDATNTKLPLEKIADCLASYFVPTVILIAVGVFIVSMVLGASLENALITFVTILVVACPCSLGLATPLAIIVSEGLCATNGLLIKKSEILENAAKTTAIVFDKTGTLTYGKLQIEKIINYSKIAEEKLLQIVSSIEKQSTHPIASAFENYLEKKQLPILPVKNFKNIAGYGIIGEIDNHSFLLGNAKILKKYHLKNTHIQDEQTLTKNGNSVIYVVKDQEIIAMIGVNDIVRTEAKKLVQTLSNRKIKVVMLTGDHEETAKKIANMLEIQEVFANVLPSEKDTYIKKLKQEGHFVMMCGDGINDSPALATADIGISITGATDIASDSSDVILTKNDLNGIIQLIDISKKTIHNIKQNLFWAFFYNALMIPIASGVLKPIGLSINPMLASIAMVLSSLTVILNTLRLKKVSFSN